MKRNTIDIIREFNKYISQEKVDEDENKLKRSKSVIIYRKQEQNSVIEQRFDKIDTSLFKIETTLFNMETNFNNCFRNVNERLDNLILLSLLKEINVPENQKAILKKHFNDQFNQIMSNFQKRNMDKDKTIQQNNKVINNPGINTKIMNKNVDVSPRNKSGGGTTSKIEKSLNDNKNNINIDKKKFSFTKKIKKNKYLNDSKSSSNSHSDKTFNYKNIIDKNIESPNVNSKISNLKKKIEDKFNKTAKNKINNRDIKNDPSIQIHKPKVKYTTSKIRNYNKKKNQILFFGI